jgi:hypothetical protein
MSDQQSIVGQVAKDSERELCPLEIEFVQIQIIQYLQYCSEHYKEPAQMQVALQKLNEYLAKLPKKALNKSNS